MDHYCFCIWCWPEGSGELERRDGYEGEERKGKQKSRKISWKLSWSFNHPQSSPIILMTQVTYRRSWHSFRILTMHLTKELVLLVLPGSLGRRSDISQQGEPAYLQQQTWAAVASDTALTCQGKQDSWLTFGVYFSHTFSLWSALAQNHTEKRSWHSADTKPLSFFPSVLQVYS